ncbi:MAG TPA: hypothetical protein VHG28_19645 [Longimicrobiaceae bacterium]|nr:hypothetical protein [Longimicrobiaceae bacterium]
MRRAVSHALALLLAGGTVLPVPAQEVATAASFSGGSRPDTVTVGDRFLTILQVEAPPGARVELPPRPDNTVEVQSVGPGIRRSDPSGRRYTVAFPLVAWRPGALPRPSARVTVRYPEGSVRTLRVPLKIPYVRSVLPQDTSRIHPRGPKDVIGPNRDPRLIALLAALAALLLATLVYLLVRAWRRRGRRVAPGHDPRARALAALDRARRLRLIETEEWKAFYTLTSEALRGYLGALSPRWGTDLTTWEIVEALGEDSVDMDAVERLGELLREADRVKFARGSSSAAEAERHWSEARRWVEGLAPRAGRPGGAAQEVAG